MSEITRALASVRKISEIKPHSNADALELAMIDGWQVIVKKGEFKPDDLCVYFEIDSFLPIEDRYDFLKRNSYRDTKNLGKGFRLRTIKLRGELSQGLALPLSAFPEIIYQYNYIPLQFETEEETRVHWEKFYNEKSENDMAWVFGPTMVPFDVTKLLKVQKFEKPIPACLRGRIRGNFPDFIPKTDETRIQNLKYREIDRHWNDTFEVSEKLDGSSMTVYIKNDVVGVCSRNLDILEDEKNSFWIAAREQNLVGILESYKERTGRNIAIQGELIGEGIQNNPYEIKGVHFYLFNIYDIDNQCYFGSLDRQSFCFENSVDHVPLLWVMQLNYYDRDTLKSNLLEYAEGKSILNNKTEREGVVFKSYDGTFSFKAISNKFLLGEKE